MSRRLSGLLLFLTLFATSGIAADADGDRLSKAAQAFAASSVIEDLVGDNMPRLEQAYPLVVKDYYDNTGPYQALPEFDSLAVDECAQHYAGVWLGQRFWWPTDDTGAPDWSMIYVHILDHYFGYCLQQPAL